MAKKKDDGIDKAYEKMIKNMLEQLEEQSPGIISEMNDRIEERKEGNGPLVLDELTEFESNKHEVPKKKPRDFKTLPSYVDFWNNYDGMLLSEEYDQFTKGCERHVKDKNRLAADINMFIESVPVFYSDKGILGSENIQMIAAAIAKYKLDACKLPLLGLLRCEDFVIKDCFTDDESTAMNIFAELCHEYLDELFDIATDDNVMPYARGIAIAAIAKSQKYSPKDVLLITGLLRKVIETYRERAKADRKVSVALIRATSLIAARMHVKTLLPLIQETYKKLRISSKGCGAISKVEQIMDDEEKHLGVDETIVENLERLIEFQTRFDFNFDEDEDEDEFDDEEYFDDYEDIDNEWDDDKDWEDDKEFDDRTDSLFKMPELKLSDLMKVNLTGGKLRILGEDFAKAHPKGLATTTDMEYIAFANGIVKRISNLYPDLENLDIKTIAMKCTLYFEDVIADAGIWRSFTETMRKMYGKPLPFYKVDETNYYTDEPNLEDVKLLVWLARLNSHKNVVANPENVAIMHIAEVIYDYMDEMFEKMPINEALADFFHEAKFINDFYETRDVLKWAYLGSYLSSTTKALELLIDAYNTYKDKIHEDPFYLVESVVTFENEIGPLGLMAKDWVGMILESNGKKKEAEIVREMDGKFTVNHITSRGDNLFNMCTIKRPDGFAMDISKKNLDAFAHDQHDYFLGSLVKFHNDWYLNGISFWDGNLKNRFEEVSKEEETKRNRRINDYNKVVKQNGGSQVFYFKDFDSTMQFVKKDLDINTNDFQLPKDINFKQKNWVVFLPSEKDQMAFCPNAASIVCDPRNPMYDEKKAMDDYLQLPLDVPYTFAVYLMEHNLLPHAGFVHQHDKKIGEKQFRENYDFVLRCLNN